MKTLLVILFACASLQAQTLHLVLTQAQFDAANTWINAQNGWPDGKGTVRYAEALPFNQFSNCPAPLQNRVGLVLDRALIRHCRLEGETKEDAIVRIFTIVKNQLSNPTVVLVVPTGDDETMTADFTDVTASVVQRLRDEVSVSFTWDASTTPDVEYVLFGDRDSIDVGQLQTAAIQYEAGPELTATVAIPTRGLWEFVVVATKDGAASGPSNKVKLTR